MSPIKFNFQELLLRSFVRINTSSIEHLCTRVLWMLVSSIALKSPNKNERYVYCWLNGLSYLLEYDSILIFNLLLYIGTIHNNREDNKHSRFPNRNQLTWEYLWLYNWIYTVCKSTKVDPDLSAYIYVSLFVFAVFFLIS